MDKRPNQADHYWVASMAIPVGKWVGFVRFIIISFSFLSVSVKVLPVTPLVSGVFVHRAFCAYFLRIERIVDFSGGHSRIINLTCNGVESHVTRMAF